MFRLLKRSWIVFFFILPVMVLWIGIHAWISTHGKIWLTNYVNNAYPSEFTIAEVRSNYLNSVTLTRVSLQKPAPVKIEEIVLSLRPWKLFSISRLQRKLLFISMQGIEADVDADSLIDNPSGQRIGAAPNLKFPAVPFACLVSEGKMNLRLRGERFEFNELSAESAVNRSGLELKLTGRTGNFGLVSIQLLARNGETPVWQIVADSKKINGRAINPFLGKLSEKGQIKEGFIQSVLRAKGSWPIRSGQTDWFVEASGENLIWEGRQGTFQVPVSFKASMDSKELTIQSASITPYVLLHGKIDDPLHRPFLNLKGESRKLSLAKIKDSFAIKSQWEGEISGSFDMKGHVSSLSVNGLFQMSPRIGRIQLPLVSGEGRIDQDQLLVTANLAEGQVRVKGPGFRPTKEDYLLSINDVSLAAFGGEHNWRNVGGFIDSQMVLHKLQPGVDLGGRLTVRDLSWGRHKSSQPIHAHVHVGTTSFNALTENKTLTVKTIWDDPFLRLEDFHVRFDETEIEAEGTIDFKQRLIDLTIAGKKLSPDIWPPMVIRYPNVKGALDFNGQLTGELDHITALGNITFEGLQFIEGGGVWEGTGQVDWKNNKLTLKDLLVNGGYAGHLVWENPIKNDVVLATFTLVNSTPRLLFDVLKSTYVVSGSLDGQAQIQYENKKWQGSGSINWTEGQVNGFSFDHARATGRIDGQTLVLQDMSLLRGSQAIKGEGRVDLRKDPWIYSFEWQLQRMGLPKLKGDGVLKVAGTLSLPEKRIQGNATSPAFWLNGIPLEDLKLDFRRNGFHWGVSGASNSGLKLTVSGDFNEGRLKGSLDWQSLSIQEMLKEMLPKSDPQKWPTGACRLKATFDGTLQSPSAWIQVESPAVRWRQEEMASKITFRIDRSTVHIEAGGELKNGGRFSSRGEILLTDQTPVSFKGQGSGVNLQSVFHLLNWPIRWEGEGEAEFSMEGPLNKRKAVIEFKGEHQGFGPFEKGGTIAGRARWEKGTWNLTGIRVASGNGHVQLLEGSQIYVDKNESGKLRIVGDIRNVEAGVLTFFGRAELTGSWAVPPSGERTRENVSVDLDVFARSLWINQLVLDGNITHLSIKKGLLEFSPIVGSGQQISGTLNYESFPNMAVKNFRYVEGGQERLYINGLIGKIWDFELNTKGFDASIIRGIFDTTIPLEGPVDMKVRGRGTPEKPLIDADILWTNGSLAFLPLDMAKCKVKLENGLLTVDQLTAQRKKGYQLAGRMKFGVEPEETPLRKNLEIDIAVTKGDLSILKDIWPDCTKAKGNFEGRLVIFGKKNQSSISGFVSAQKMAFRTTSYVPELSQGELRLRLAQNRLSIEEAQAKMGNGEVRLEGFVDFENGEPKFFNLALKTLGEQGASIRVPELTIPPGPVLGRLGIFKKRLGGISRGEPKVSLTLKGPSTDPVLQGQVDLENSVFTYPPPKSAQREKRLSRIAQSLRNFRDRIRWDVTLNAGSRTWYENQLEEKLGGVFVNSRISGGVSFNGPSSDLIVNGRFATKQGSIVIFGNDFKIADALLEIQTATATTVDRLERPSTTLYLKGTAEREVFYTDGTGNGNEDTIVVKIDRALLNEIEPRFYAKNNAGLSPQKASQLALGLPYTDIPDQNLPLLQPQQPGRTKEENEKLIRTAVVQFLDSSFASPIARALVRQTGLVDFIRVTYQDRDRFSDSESPLPTDVGKEGTVGNVTGNPFLRYTKGTKVQLGRELSDRLFADYSFRVDEFENQLDLRHEVELAYRLHRNFFLRAISELDSQRTLGRPPDRRAILENQWRFGLPRKKTILPKKESRVSQPALPPCQGQKG